MNDYAILIERGNYTTHCGFVGYDITERSIRTPKIKLEKQFKHLFEDVLKIDPSTRKIVLVKDAGTTQENLKKEAELLFRKFKVKALAFCCSQKGVIYSSGIRGTNALIIDIGYEKTKIVPIIDFNTQKEKLVTLEFGGKDIEQYIVKHLTKYGTSKKIIEQNKEKLFPTLMKEYYYFDSESINDFEEKAIRKRKEELQKNLILKKKKGKEIRIKLPNPILPSNLLTKINKEISHHLLKSLKYFGEEALGSNFEHNDTIWRNGRIIVTGGVSNMLGMRSLLIRDLIKNTELTQGSNPSKNKMDIILNDETYTINNLPYSETPYSWIGCSIERSLKDFTKKFITKEEFERNPNLYFPFDQNMLTE